MFLRLLHRLFPDPRQRDMLVLRSIGTGDIFGRDLRTKLAEQELKKSGPAFYQMMSRFEESGYVEGYYKEKIVEGYLIRLRCYRLTENGRKQLVTQ